MEKLTKYVDMRFGTWNDGTECCCTIGPNRPNASVAPGPDTFPTSYSTGYKPENPIRGFSQLHINAGGPRYLNFLLSPQIGLSTALDAHDSEKENEIPTISDYSVTLKRYGIDVSLAPTEHSVIYKLTYPKAEKASIVLDMLWAYGKPRDITVNVGEDENGHTTFFGGLCNGQNPRHNIYFYAVLEKEATEKGVYMGEKTHIGRKYFHVYDVSDDAQKKGMGTYACFGTKENETVFFKIAISFKSPEKAKEWLDAEIPSSDYDGVKKETERIWEEKLSKLKIDESTPTDKKLLFYSMLFRCYINPRDRKGDYMQYGDDEDMIDDHICTWDTFRTLYPLYTIIEPEFVAKTIRSYVTRLDTNGCVRDMVLGGVERDRNQGGDNIDIIIAEAYAKGIEGVKWEDAYRVMKDNAENWRRDEFSWGWPKNESYYRSELGYIPADRGEEGNLGVMGCSRTLEYAYNDYCCATVAKGLGYIDDYNKYMKRSESWKKIWNSDIESHGFRGFTWPKTYDGKWVDASERLSSVTQRCKSWNNYYYEGTSYEYSFFVPHDIKTLIGLMGGDKRFCDRIETGMKELWINPDNQPGLLPPFLASATNEPWRTSDIVDMNLKRYNQKSAPGCEDSGCMSAWYLFAVMGFYPNAGQDYYFITSPKLKSVTIELGSGKTLKIRTANLSEENRYIQSIMLNGKTHRSSVIKHSDITNGGELIFTMGKTAVDYTKTEENK